MKEVIYWACVLLFQASVRLFAYVCMHMSVGAHIPGAVCTRLRIVVRLIWLASVV